MIGMIPLSAWIACEHMEKQRKRELIKKEGYKMSAAIQIEAVLKSENRPMYLHEIREAIIDQFGAWHSESAISARIRGDVRPKLLKDGILLKRKAPKGKHANQYWLEPIKVYDNVPPFVMIPMLTAST